MTIIAICRWLKFGGGMEKFFALFANEMAHRYGERIYVILLGRRYDDEYTLDKKIKIAALNEIRESCGILDGLSHNIKLYQKLFKMINKIQPDIIVSFLPEIASVCKWRFPGIKIIGSLRVNANVDLRRWKDHFLSVAATRNLDGFIFLTDGARKNYPDRIVRKSIVIPLAVETPSAIVDYKTLSEKKKIYASGRLVKGKHFEVIIKAFSIVHKNYPDYHLVILGDGDERAFLEKLIIRLSLKESIDMPGIDRHPMKTMLDGYMYVFASESEGYSNALSEAMMIGLPCVATDCEFGPSDMITNKVNGLLVPIGGVHEMADAMDKLIRNPELARLFSSRSSAFRQSHSIQRVMELYHTYMVNVAENKYRVSLKQKIYNRLSTTEFTIGWAKIENEKDTLLQKDKKFFHFMPLNGKEWYADPFVIEKNNKTYIFMEHFDVKDQKGKISYSILSEKGITKPRVIIDEHWHMSFPFIFEHEGIMYMLPETNATGKFYIYRCVQFPEKWKIMSVIEAGERLSDTVVVDMNGEKIVLSSEKKQDNGLFTRTRVGRLIFAEDKISIDKTAFYKINENQEFSLYARNGGAPFKANGSQYRVTQESTPVYYGIALRFFEICQLNEETFLEEEIKRVDINNINSDFKGNYRQEGIHTYGRTGKFEVIDLKLTKLKSLI